MTVFQNTFPANGFLRSSTTRFGRIGLMLWATETSKGPSRRLAVTPSHSWKITSELLWSIVCTALDRTSGPFTLLWIREDNSPFSLQSWLLLKKKDSMFTSWVTSLPTESALKPGCPTTLQFWIDSLMSLQDPSSDILTRINCICISLLERHLSIALLPLPSLEDRLRPLVMSTLVSKSTLWTPTRYVQRMLIFVNYSVNDSI